MILYHDTPIPLWLELLLLALALMAVTALCSWAIAGAYVLHVMSDMDPKVLWQMQLVEAETTNIGSDW